MHRRQRQWRPHWSCECRETVQYDSKNYLCHWFMKCLLIELITVECHSTELPHSYIHHTSWLLITYNLKSIELNRASNQNYDSLWWLVLLAWPRRTIVRCHQKLSGALFASLTRTGHKSYDPQGLKIIVMLCVCARALGAQAVVRYMHISMESIQT